jgi:predicted RNA binding protein YcfA (HicA-like mRNA interferase family)
LEGIVKNKKRFTSISLHNEPLPKGTLKAILKQTGADEEEIKKIA